MSMSPHPSNFSFETSDAFGWSGFAEKLESFWNVEGGSGPSYKFYRFLQKFRQVYEVHNEEASVDGLGNFTAVLDGQQRLTSIWIGLKGSYAYKEKRLHWNNDERCLPSRQLYLNKALNIFIRINSGGQPLNFSDLTMSIAVSNWQAKDARKEIHALVDSVRGIGFSISKDLIFKAYLYLCSRDIRFKATNFSADNAHNFEKDWEKIRDAILASFELVRDFGYNEFTLTSKNVVIPVICYLYHRGIYGDFGTSVKYRADRETIQKWLHIMLLKRVLGAGGADGLLSQVRRAFTDDVLSNEPIKPAIQSFPAAEINWQLKRDMSVGEEFIQDLLGTQKDDRYAFCILALLNPQLDYRNNDFHLDHLHPISGFTKKAAAALKLSPDDEEIFLSSEWNNSIVNLQMLDSNENMSKQAKSLEDWVTLETKKKERAAFLDRCIIPQKSSLQLDDFATFAKERDALLTEKLSGLLK